MQISGLVIPASIKTVVTLQACKNYIPEAITKTTLLASDNDQNPKLLLCNLFDTKSIINTCL